MTAPLAGGRGARASARPDRRRSESGQATVELALLLPLIFALFVLLFQITLIGRDELLVVHAARDAAREATLTSDFSRISAAANRTLPGATVRLVRRGRVGQPVSVTVSFVSRTDVPLVGGLVPDVTLHSDTVMRVERP